MTAYGTLFKQYLGAYDEEDWYEAFISRETPGELSSPIVKENVKISKLLLEAVEPWVKEYSRGYSAAIDIQDWLEGSVLDALADSLDKFVSILNLRSIHPWLTLNGCSAEVLQGRLRAQVVQLLELFRRGKNEPLLATLEDYLSLRDEEAEPALTSEEKESRARVLTKARRLLDSFWSGPITAAPLEDFIKALDELDEIAPPSSTAKAVRKYLREEQEERAIRELWVASTAADGV